ncbi:MAG TPA: signal peptidase I [Symbiobacteriaceae bacterium]
MLTEGPEKPESELPPESGELEPVNPAPDQAGTPEPPAQAEAKAKPPGKSAAREWLETIVIALLVALVIRTFIVQVYVVDGESMEPTLHTGERFLVNKFVFRFRSPNPGEVVVLKDPGKPTRELIKRVVAVAGETVEVKGGVTYVDNKALKEPYVNRLFPIQDSAPTKVPPGTIYVMGDNRGRSFDSRAIGPIILNKVEGKAFFMLWPFDRFAAGPLEQPRVPESATK